MADVELGKHPSRVMFWEDIWLFTQIFTIQVTSIAKRGPRVMGMLEGQHQKLPSSFAAASTTPTMWLAEPADYLHLASVSTLGVSSLGISTTGSVPTLGISGSCHSSPLDPKELNCQFRFLGVCTERGEGDVGDEDLLFLNFASPVWLVESSQRLVHGRRRERWEMMGNVEVEKERGAWRALQQFREQVWGINYEELKGWEPGSPSFSSCICHLQQDFSKLHIIVLWVANL